VANRIPNIKEFASRHDVILFVCGKKSSNGKVLYNQCLSVNPQTYMIDEPSEIDLRWFQGIKSVGICGATSTPKWLMEDCKKKIEYDFVQEGETR
jgi:4-hydroxy-3-methylbut-2-enyl diphosphate reductase